MFEYSYQFSSPQLLQVCAIQKVELLNIDSIPYIIVCVCVWEAAYYVC